MVELLPVTHYSKEDLLKQMKEKMGTMEISRDIRQENLRWTVTMSNQSLEEIQPFQRCGKSPYSDRRPLLLSGDERDDRV